MTEIKTVIIPKEEIDKVLNVGLKKDLIQCEDYNEEICPTCHGTGVTIHDNPYGLFEQAGPVRFPYVQQSIGFCPDCYNGVVKRCLHCGKIIPKGRLKCECRIPAERQKKEEEHRKMIDELRWATPEESVQDMYYSPEYPYNEGYFETFEDFFDAWYDNHSPEDAKPECCFPTHKCSMTLDMEGIVADACDELYEDAFDDVGNIKELQDLVDAWIKKNGPGDSFLYHESYKIRIPWGEAEK